MRIGMVRIVEHLVGHPSSITRPRCITITYRGEDVVQTLEDICRKTGYPKTIRVDNGSEFISRDLDL